VPDIQDAPKAWREALDRSAAQFAAGQTVDGGDVLRRLDESIARLEVKEVGARRR
jgi:hypothetical protein